MALLEVRTEWAVYKNCFLQVAKYQADNSRAMNGKLSEEKLVAFFYLQDEKSSGDSNV